MAEAQNYESDALKFSMQNYSGSARYTALGGAFSSVGADISNLSHNPAGIGMYRSSVFQASLGVNYAKLNSTFYGEENQDLKVSVNMPNLGAIFATNKPSKNGMIRSAAFGIGLMRLADYNANEKISTFNTNPFSSITWSWADEMNNVFGTTNVDLDQDLVNLNNLSFETYNGYYGYLVNYDSLTLANAGYAYTSPVIDSFQQTRYVDTKGGKNEMVISGGANYLDKLYFGASIGIPFINYEKDTRFIEEDAANSETHTFFNEFELKQNYKTEGVGFNLKLGAIYKVNDWLRVSGAFHTPERLSFSETYTSYLYSSTDFGITNYDEIVGEFDYKLRLPWKANAGFSLFYKKNGFIAVDYEAIGYNSTKYDFGNNFQETSDAINAGIKAKYQVGHNVRIGLEGVVKKLRLRGGYNYTGSPIRSDYAVDGYDFTRHTISGGFGFVFEKIALDFAYQHHISNQFEQPYTVESINVSGINKNLTQGSAIVSFAYKLN